VLLSITTAWVHAAKRLVLFLFTSRFTCYPRFRFLWFYLSSGLGKPYHGCLWWFLAYTPAAAFLDLVHKETQCISIYLSLRYFFKEYHEGLQKMFSQWWPAKFFSLICRVLFPCCQKPKTFPPYNTHREHFAVITHQNYWSHLSKCTKCFAVFSCLTYANKIFDIYFTAKFVIISHRVNISQ